MRRPQRAFGYALAIFAGALCCEALRLLAMNRADKMIGST